MFSTVLLYCCLENRLEPTDVWSGPIPVLSTEWLLQKNKPDSSPVTGPPCADFNLTGPFEGTVVQQWAGLKETISEENDVVPGQLFERVAPPTGGEEQPLQQGHYRATRRQQSLIVQRTIKEQKKENKSQIESKDSIQSVIKTRCIVSTHVTASVYLHLSSMRLESKDKMQSLI